MTKLRGPALSQAASGTIAGAVTISSWKGRPYIKRRSTITDVNTAPQISSRQMMSWLAAQWSPMPDEKKLTWLKPAQSKNIPGYNAFLEENLQRWAQLKSPTQTYPATEDTSSGTAGTYPLIYPHPLALRLTFRIYTLGDAWGFHLFRGPVYGFPLTVDRHIATFLKETKPLETFFLRDQPAGDAWYVGQIFSHTGKKQHLSLSYKLRTIPFA